MKIPTALEFLNLLLQPSYVIQWNFPLQTEFYENGIWNSTFCCENLSLSQVNISEKHLMPTANLNIQSSFQMAFLSSKESSLLAVSSSGAQPPTAHL